MTDEELDAALTRSRSAIPTGAAAEARRLVRATRPTQAPRRARRWVLPAAVAGALALTGGANLAAAQMEIWPYVGMPADNLRTSEPIPLIWTTEDGHHEECGAWLEFADTPKSTVDAVEEAILETDWTGFGQNLYDAGSPQPRDPGGESRVSTELDARLDAFVREHAPSVAPLSGAGRSRSDDDGNLAAPESPRIAAQGFLCSTT